MHARIQIYWCRSSIFRHLKLELLTQFPASNDEKYINVVYIWRKFVSFYVYVHWRMTTEISVMYGSEKVNGCTSRRSSSSCNRYTDTRACTHDTRACTHTPPFPLAPVAETGFSHRLTAYKIVGHFFGLPYLNMSGIIRSKIVFFRISNISVQFPHAQLKGRTVIKKLWTFFGPWGRDRSQSPPCWIFRVRQIHQSTASERTTRRSSHTHSDIDTAISACPQTTTRYLQTDVWPVKKPAKR